MRAPRRLLENGASPLEMALLRSAKGDGPPPGALERAMAIVDAPRGLGAPSAPTSGLGASVARGAFEIARWMVIGVAGGVLFHGDLNPPNEAIAARPEAPAVIAGVESVAQPDAPSAIEAVESGELPEASTAEDTSRSAINGDARPPGAGARADVPRRAMREPQKRGEARAGAAKAAAPSLAEEVDLLDVARRALARGDAGAALVALDKHAAQFPAGALRPEAALLRVDVMKTRGDQAGAVAAARAILDERPAGPYAKHLREIVGEPGSGAGAASGGQ